jgi:hypothetical protein
VLLIAAVGVMLSVAVVAQAPESFAEPLDADVNFAAKLQGKNEVPALASFARGTFTAVLAADLSEISWTLEYEGVEDVAQAHIHLGQAGVNGGIMLFLCSNLGNGPAGTQACPAGSGTLSGTSTGVDIVGPGAQGVAAGNFFLFQRGLRQGVAYANVHSTTFPGGEIRGQLRVVP